MDAKNALRFFPVCACFCVLVIPTGKSKSMNKLGESRPLIEELVDALRLDFDPTYNVKLCMDLKVTNLVTGLQTHSSKHPCYLCTWDSDNGDFRQKYPLRSPESITKHYKKWLNSGAIRSDLLKHKNCQDVPLAIFNKQTAFREHIPPPELHLHLGISNHLFKSLPESVQNEWLEEGGVTRPNYHSGDLLGNDCDKLLKSVKNLRKILKQKSETNSLTTSQLEGAYETADLIELFEEVKHKCFGKKLLPGWNEAISKLRRAWKCQDISVTPKVHILFAHVPSFCREFGALGQFNEQALESVHADFCMRAWEKYKVRDLDRPSMGKLLRAAILEYNALAVL